MIFLSGCRLWRLGDGIGMGMRSSSCWMVCSVMLVLYIRIVIFWKFGFLYYESGFTRHIWRAKVIRRVLFCTTVCTVAQCDEKRATENNNPCHIRRSC